MRENHSSVFTPEATCLPVKMRLPSRHPHYVPPPPPFLYIVLFCDQEPQSQFCCQKPSIRKMSMLNPSNMLCYWPEYKWRPKTKHWALLLVSYCLCVLISDTANIRQSTHALSQLENLHYKLRERGEDQRVMRGKETERGRNG